MSSPLDRTISFSFFENVRSTNPDVQQFALRSLTDHVLKEYPATSEDIKEARRALPLFKPAIFNGGREAKDLLSIDAIEGDYDLGLQDASFAYARLLDARIAAFIYTTSRHTQEYPRYRIICPLSRTMAPEEWGKYHSFLNDLLDGALDPNAAKASQCYFIGRLDICEKPDVHMVEGSDCDFIDCVYETHPLGKSCLRHDLRDPAEAEDEEDPFSGVKSRLERKRELVLSMLSVIPSDDYDTWTRVGLILHHEFGASGFALWDEWSLTSPGYGRTLEKWKSFAKPTSGKPAGLGSLRFLARKFGWSDPDTDPDVVWMNERHALVMMGGKALVATFYDDGTIEFGQLKDIHALYANKLMPVGERRTESISQKWAKHPDRRTYIKGVTFDPGRHPKDKLNLWTGWKLGPDPDASCQLYLDHLLQVICGGDLKIFYYLLGWLAHLVQRPWEKPGVALVLLGGKGAGKDTVVDYLVPVIGRQHVPTVAHHDHVTGRFNSRLENALILHLQEGIWGGDRKAEQVLKYAITSGNIEIERKGVDTVSKETCFRVIMTGNEPWMVPASADERRYAVLEVSNCRQGDAHYFSALRAEMGNGGPAALLHHLQNYDLNNFDVREAPSTKGLLAQKLKSLRGVEKWWFECLTAGEFLPKLSMGTDDEHALQWEMGQVSVHKSRIRDAYAAYLRSRRHEGDPVDDATFSKALREVLPSLRIERPRHGEERPRHFVFPKLDVCREEFAKKQGGNIDWSTK